MRGSSVRSWVELVDKIALDSFDPRLKRFRSPFAFRGICADWPLKTSLQRLNHPQDTLRHIEKAMFRNFKKYAYQELDPSSSDWKWLAVAQHHGLPTRLLDWTFSPFVAMHFATNELDKMDKDGVVWMVNFDRSRRYQPQVLQESLRRHFALTFSVEMLEDDEDLRNPFKFEESEGSQNPFVMFFEPPSLDPRIVNQWGLFSFMNRSDVRLDEWLSRESRRDPDLVRKIVIKARAKWEIRDKLDGMNLTERVLMPGLDGLSTWLKRWYSPKLAHPVDAPAGPHRASTTAPVRASARATARTTGVQASRSAGVAGGAAKRPRGKPSAARATARSGGR